jgi:hypothetical protein
MLHQMTIKRENKCADVLAMIQVLGHKLKLILHHDENPLDDDASTEQDTAMSADVIGSAEAVAAKPCVFCGQIL